ncbi:hypothetical protein EDD16DRAFT_1730513 [Pisolithus croceorrhizus]|nr:hypothetical protein EDD16DRAFT_1730513 [Pisolithus croceorrhizus]KAI6154339.1 hypothetical protein EDD17DRAFT_1090297 [Pisolithus thermaeus]
MHLPLILRPGESPRRRGGTMADGDGVGISAGGDGGSGGSSESPGESTSGDGTSTDGEPSEVPLSPSSSISLGKSSATAYGDGGGDSIPIPDGEPFAGRSAGGGTRDQTFGSKTYGSGYPGITGCGVSGRGFPFWFWPVVWSDAAAEIQPCLNGSEYGDAYNTSRFGGPLMEVTFISNSSSPNTTFHVLSDNSTVTSLIQSIDANCSHYLSSSLIICRTPIGWCGGVGRGIIALVAFLMVVVSARSTGFRIASLATGLCVFHLTFVTCKFVFPEYCVSSYCNYVHGLSRVFTYGTAPG